MRKEQLFKTMESIVEQNVELYRSDFELDKRMIDSIESDFELVWIVRDCGTFLFHIEDGCYNPLDTIKCIEETMKVKGYYYISGSKGNYMFGKASKESVHYMLEDAQKCRIEVHLEDGMTYSVELLASDESDAQHYTDGIPGASFSELRWV